MKYDIKTGSNNDLTNYIFFNTSDAYLDNLDLNDLEEINDIKTILENRETLGFPYDPILLLYPLTEAHIRLL